MPGAHRTRIAAVRCRCSRYMAPSSTVRRIVNTTAMVPADAVAVGDYVYLKLTVGEPPNGTSRERRQDGPGQEATLQVAVLPGDRGDRDRSLARAFLSRDRHRDEAVRRWAHQAAQRS